MDLEKIATGAITTELAKTDRLNGFINSGDKEPCWDGHIYIHEDKRRTKKNIKKVATQVKGKAVHKRSVKRTISYSVSYDDLHAYMMNGGTMFFVVYIDQDNGNPLQIYYDGLLPVKIKGILKVKKNSYTLKLRKFPTNNTLKAELLINFYEDARKQASFAGKELPSIDDLARQGVLESLSISYTGLDQYDSYSAFPKIIDGNALTIYANIKGGVAPIPVEYFDRVSHFTMRQDNDIPVGVKEHVYYTSFSTIATADLIEHHIGSSVKLSSPNTGRSEMPVGLNIEICLKGTLNERIAAIEFIIAMIKHKSLRIGNSDITVNFSQSEMDRLGIDDLSEMLSVYKRIKNMLKSINVSKDLDIEKCTKEDLEKLNLLLGAIENRRPIRGIPDNPASIQKMTIQNITLALVYLRKYEVGYYILDYFSNQFHVTWASDDATPTQVSQFFSMGTDDYLTLDNLNLKMVIDDFKRIPPSSDHWNHGNNAMLHMIQAYDRSSNEEYLNAAGLMCEWLQENPHLLPNNIIILNKLQIEKRKRALTFQEKTELHSIAETATDPLHRIGAFLLLDEQKEAQELIELLSADELNSLKEYPIYRFYSIQ